MEGGLPLSESLEAQEHLKLLSVNTVLLQMTTYCILEINIDIDID